MFHQTFHEKGLIGGYLSRVSLTAKRFHRRLPVLDALMTLAERQPLSPHQLEHARRATPDFVRRARIGYVIFRTDQITPELRALALDLFQLTLVQSDGTRELYVTRFEIE